MPKDKYGRDWRYPSPHETGRMLRIPGSIATAACNLQRLLRGMTGDGVDLTRNDNYLLKTYTNEWVFGSRWGSGPSDYYSPGLDSRLIRLIIQHQHDFGNFNEQKAVEALL